MTYSQCLSIVYKVLICYIKIYQVTSFSIRVPFSRLCDLTSFMFTLNSFKNLCRFKTSLFLKLMTTHAVFSSLQISYETLVRSSLTFFISFDLGFVFIFSLLFPFSSLTCLILLFYFASPQFF